MMIMVDGGWEIREINDPLSLLPFASRIRHKPPVKCMERHN